MFYKTYLENNYLVIETFFLKEKIAVSSIDDIIILYNKGWNVHKIFMYFTQPVQYEVTKNSLFYQILYRLFLGFNSDRYRILRKYDNQLLTAMFSLLKPYLTTIIETKYLDLERSFTWRTFDEGSQFKQMKLVFSKDGLGLKKVLIKHQK